MERPKVKSVQYKEYTEGRRPQWVTYLFYPIHDDAPELGGKFIYGFSLDSELDHEKMDYSAKQQGILNNEDEAYGGGVLNGDLKWERDSRTYIMPVPDVILHEFQEQLAQESIFLSDSGQ